MSERKIEVSRRLQIWCNRINYHIIKSRLDGRVLSKNWHFKMNDNCIMVMDNNEFNKIIHDIRQSDGEYMVRIYV